MPAYSKYLHLFFLVLSGVTFMQPSGKAEHSVARLWNEQNLDAIRVSFPHPPVHARNLFHTSVAMWDAWAAFSTEAVGYCYHEDATADDIQAAREEAISYAAYRVLVARYKTSFGADTILPALETQLIDLGFDPAFTSTEGDSPATLGNRIAEQILSFSINDNSNEENDYEDPTYTPANEPLILLFSGTEMDNPNRWQPLAFEVSFSQNGIEADKIQTFLGSHWGEVWPFAIERDAGEAVYFDPGLPPQLGGLNDPEFKDGNVEVIYRSSLLHPDAENMIDISPGAIGNNTLGLNDGTGYPQNPTTGAAYSANLVNHADFGRVVAEFWADGPDSETPPGHWNTLANKVVDHPAFSRKIGGEGPELDPLEWDVKMYFALNGAVHDAAIAAWGCKLNYDYVRPISSIRHLAANGQSSEPTGPSYHVNGIPLAPDLIEVITEESSAEGERHEHLADDIGEIAIFAWGGEPEDPETEYTGAKWILAADWLPYQRDTFVTPAFAGYVSGHSAFSRAAAEVLTELTGSPFFPGGISSHTAPAHSLEFESGPSEDITLQWATYYDAADQAGISRLYGGIHVPIDDGPGRIMGSKCGLAAVAMAKKYYDSSILHSPFDLRINLNEEGNIVLDWKTVRGMSHRVQSGSGLNLLTNLSTATQAEETHETFVIPSTGAMQSFFTITRQPGRVEE